MCISIWKQKTLVEWNGLVFKEEKLIYKCQFEIETMQKTGSLKLKLKLYLIDISGTITNN